MTIVAILALVVAALAGGAYAYLVYSPKPQMPSLNSEVQHATMRVGDRERNYLAYVPARLPSGAALVIVLHGSGMDGAKMRAWTGYEFDHMADQQGFIVLYPDGYRHNWNDCRKNATFPAKAENIDDMGFIRALIDRVKAEHAINPKRVYAFGYSNGGHMAFRLAIEAPSEVAAIAALGASLPTPDSSSCSQLGETSRAMLVDGTNDPINPYQGGVVTLFGFGNRGKAMSAKDSARTFAERNGITTAPEIARMEPRKPDDPTSVEILTWSARGKPISRLYTVHGGGHVIPQPVFRFPRLFGKTTSALDAPSAAMEFFAQ
jgi:polyhydroxybutyrate depolymerase